MDLRLHMNWLVLLQVVVKRRAMILAFEQFDIVLKSFQTDLLLKLHKSRLISFHCLQIGSDVFQFRNQLFRGILSTNEQLDLIFM